MTKTYNKSFTSPYHGTINDYDLFSDIWFKNLFKTNTEFEPVPSIKDVPYPYNMSYHKEDGLRIQLPIVSIKKEDISISIEFDKLTIQYDKPKADKDSDGWETITHSLSHKSFKLCWKINSRFDLGSISAKAEDGLLTLSIPFSENNKPKTVNID